tara:strand:- start:3651 stop:3833 length:183 start_codon:yes stop_codon:yes gene_type:complete
MPSGGGKKRKSSLSHSKQGRLTGTYKFFSSFNTVAVEIGKNISVPCFQFLGRGRANFGVA